MSKLDSSNSVSSTPFKKCLVSMGQAPQLTRKYICPFDWGLLTLFAADQTKSLQFFSIHYRETFGPNMWCIHSCLHCHQPSLAYDLVQTHWLQAPECTDCHSLLVANPARGRNEISVFREWESTTAWKYNLFSWFCYSSMKVHTKTLKCHNCSSS